MAWLSQRAAHHSATVPIIISPVPSNGSSADRAVGSLDFLLRASTAQLNSTKTRREPLAFEEYPTTALTGMRSGLLREANRGIAGTRRWFATIIQNQLCEALLTEFWGVMACWGGGGGDQSDKRKTPAEGVQQPGDGGSEANHLGGRGPRPGSEKYFQRHWRDSPIAATRFISALPWICAGR
jgi:hypothetical protein